MRRSDIAGIALGIVGILVAILFAVTGEIPRWLGIVLAIAVIACVLLYFRRDIAAQFGHTREERDRARLRQTLQLRVVGGAETDSSPQELPDGVFGYEEILAVQGLKDGRARLKPDRDPYPLEVHKRDGAVCLVGFLSDEDRDTLSGNRAGSVILWMRRQKGARTLGQVPLSRVEDEQSRGDGRYGNPFRLLLGLRSSPIE
jgi:hypothetical protein